jgi:hypothetical protein
VYVTYFDEVKPVNEQQTYWIGGICVAIENIPAIEAQVSALAKEVFGTSELTTNTEFHGRDIYFSKAAFKGVAPQKRLEVLSRLADILSNGDIVKRVYAAINTTKLYAPEKAAQFAFDFCERVQLCVGQDHKTLLIGDEDHEQVRDLVRDFATYRMHGTPWDFGMEINSIVDTVHFARSHHSRMIQLADVYLFLITHSSGTRNGWMAEALTEILNAKELWAHRYKHWPA